ncbi:MAG: alpha/beta hydrolase-fold protein [Candidatus Hodarchaeota archaeon]
MKNDEIVIGKFDSLYSEIMDEKRKFIIQLPDEYEESGEKYPVVYLLNADYETYFVNGASTISYMADMGRIPHTIVVGIPTPDHGKDLFPFKVENRVTVAAAKKFLGFLTDELIPHIEREYRTQPFRILIGQSNGGLFTVYALLERPEAFNAYIAGSPMLGWGTKKICQMAQKSFRKQTMKGRFLYMSYGDRDYKHVIFAVPEFVRLLEKQGPDGLRWQSVILEGEGHTPLSTVYNGLTFVFPEWAIPTERAAEMGLEGIQRYYEDLSEKYGFTIKPPASVLLDTAYDWFMNEKLDQAQFMSEYITSNFPQVVSAHHLLGLIYQKKNNNQAAIKCYRRVLEIDPEEPRALKRLEELGEKV